MRCTENRVEDDYDGGPVIFQVIAGQQSDEYADGRLVLSFIHDTPMEAYPRTREEKQERFFKITLEEIAYSEVPPDPKAPKLPSAREFMEQALAAARRDGDTALAEELHAKLAPPSPPVE
jgi:hypothetical protein